MKHESVAVVGAALFLPCPVCRNTGETPHRDKIVIPREEVAGEFHCPNGKTARFAGAVKVKYRVEPEPGRGFHVTYEWETEAEGEVK